jgi:hypothetical protein
LSSWVYLTLNCWDLDPFLHPYSPIKQVQSLNKPSSECSHILCLHGSLWSNYYYPEGHRTHQGCWTSSPISLTHHPLLFPLYLPVSHVICWNRWKLMKQIHHWSYTW